MFDIITLIRRSSIIHLVSVANLHSNKLLQLALLPSLLALLALVLLYLLYLLCLLRLPSSFGVLALGSSFM